MDSTPGTPGTVTIQGPVTLTDNTTVTMNFTGGNNTADRLDVQGGALTLAGTLELNSTDRNKPTNPLNFFDDFSAVGTPSLTGSFLSITDNVKGTDFGRGGRQQRPADLLPGDNLLMVGGPFQAIVKGIIHPRTTAWNDSPFHCLDKQAIPLKVDVL